MSAASRYPTDIVNDNGWGRIHKGHNLDRLALLVDLENSLWQPPNTRMIVQEVYFRWIPRVKWCGRYDFPCDNEGEWHSHWVEVRPNLEAAFTVVNWVAAGEQP